MLFSNIEYKITYTIDCVFTSREQQDREHAEQLAKKIDEVQLHTLSTLRALFVYLYGACLFLH